MSRQQYLQAMGIQAYRLRQPLRQIAEAEITEPEIPELEIQEPETPEPEILEAVSQTKASPAVEPLASSADDPELLSYMGLDDGLPEDYGLDEYHDQEATAVLPPVSSLDWQGLQKRIQDCQLCELCKGRKNTVFGIGDPDAEVLIVGEAPGVDEDAAGKPFTGPAGHLLDKMLAAIGLKRQQVFITNVLKCHPLGNRDPHVGEINACRPFLQRQIELIKPKKILSVGAVSAHSLLASHENVGQLRQQQHNLPGTDLAVHVTYHPAYLLRKPSEKAKSWQDLKRFAKALEAS